MEIIRAKVEGKAIPEIVRPQAQPTQEVMAALRASLEPRRRAEDAKGLDEAAGDHRTVIAVRALPRTARVYQSR